MTARPTARADLKLHAALFDQMACTVGLDLEEEAVAGRLQFDEIAEAVLRCSRCGNVGACHKWLAAASEQAQTSEQIQSSEQMTPDFCRNRDLLGYLSDPQG